MPDTATSREAIRMRIEPLTAALGAEVLDVNLKELDAEKASELREQMQGRPAAAN